MNIISMRTCASLPYDLNNFGNIQTHCEAWLFFQSNQLSYHQHFHIAMDFETVRIPQHHIPLYGENVRIRVILVDPSCTMDDFQY
mmetsp:Transcript_18229/g.27814  ORF Transcript_18229/g.27814 Transcript_18229/m.27814 type:complete len:85 (-) Transcript_18229:149-403(-)